MLARAAAALALAFGAAVIDADKRRIPNVLVVVGAVAAIVLACTDGRWPMLVGALIGLALLAWPGHSVGGGDVKLVGVIGAFLGPVGGFGVLCVAVAIYYALPSRIFRPFAPCVLAGAATAFFIEVLPC